MYYTVFILRAAGSSVCPFISGLVLRSIDASFFTKVDIIPKHVIMYTVTYMASGTRVHHWSLIFKLVANSLMRCVVQKNYCGSLEKHQLTSRVILVQPPLSPPVQSAGNPAIQSFSNYMLFQVSGTAETHTYDVMTACRHQCCLAQSSRQRTDAFCRQIATSTSKILFLKVWNRGLGRLYRQ